MLSKKSLFLPDCIKRKSVAVRTGLVRVTICRVKQQDGNHAKYFSSAYGLITINHWS
jgi:hypothetical protein